jgi:DNA repair exonuclease SbcCD nuclease subunit
MNETYIADRPGSLWLSANGFDAAQGPLPAKALIHFLPYPTKQWYLAGKENLSIDESNEAIQQGLRGILTGFGALSSGAQCPVILVAHCNVSGSILSTGQTLLGQDIMISKHDLALAGADYVALGHIHKRQEVGPNMWYAGSTYHNNFGETEKKSLNLVTVNPPHVVTVEEVSIPSRPLSLHECTYEKGLILDENANDGDWIDADLRVRVTVAKEELELLTDEMIREKYLKAYTIQIERLVVPMERIRSTSIVRAQRLAEKVELWMKSIDKTPEPEILELANDVERSCAA